MWERGTLCHQNPNGVLRKQRDIQEADEGRAAKTRKKVSFADPSGETDEGKKRKSKKADDSTGQERQKARKTGNSAGTDSAGGQQLLAVEESAPDPPPFFTRAPALAPQDPLCLKCKQKVDPLKAVLVGKVAGSWKCPTCNSRGTQLNRLFGTWPPESFKRLDPSVQTKFYQDAKDKAGPVALKDFLSQHSANPGSSRRSPCKAANTCH